MFFSLASKNMRRKQLKWHMKNILNWVLQHLNSLCYNFLTVVFAKSLTRQVICRNLRQYLLLGNVNIK